MPALSQQTAQQRLETASVHAPNVLAHDRRVFDVRLEERIQPRTSDLIAWAETVLPLMN
jgi:hypothetical protein